LGACLGPWLGGFVDSHIYLSETDCLLILSRFLVLLTIVQASISYLRSNNLLCRCGPNGVRAAISLNCLRIPVGFSPRRFALTVMNGTLFVSRGVDNSLLGIFRYDWPVPPTGGPATHNTRQDLRACIASTQVIPGIRDRCMACDDGGGARCANDIVAKDKLQTIVDYRDRRRWFL